MKRILAFAGSKQSGKNTACNFLHGYQLRCYRIINSFAITDKGELYVDTSGLDEQGNESNVKGIIDITREDIEFAEWAAYFQWKNQQQRRGGNG